MSACKACCYWVPIEDDHHLRPVDPDTYDPIPQPFTIGQCGSPHLHFHEWPTDPGHAVLVDGSHYFAGLYTGPEFGCVAWKENI